jgi:mannose-6-phosphate isomerase-like protein (cupin superfamily)
MSDVTVKRLDDLDGYQPSPGAPKQFLYAGKGLGVASWGMNVLNLPANYKDYPEHDHRKDGQEEVYVVLKGNAALEADGRMWSLEPGVLVRVGSAVKRKILPGSEGVTILALGGTPGKAYELKPKKA